MRESLISPEKFLNFKTNIACMNLGSLACMFAIEPLHEISNNVVCATRKASDQPAHMRSLIRAFASRLNITWVLSYWLNSIWSF